MRKEKLSVVIGVAEMYFGQKWDRELLDRFW